MTVEMGSLKIKNKIKRNFHVPETNAQKFHSWFIPIIIPLIITV